MVKRVDAKNKKEKISIAPEDKKSLKIFLWIVGILIFLGVLFLVFNGITGNAIITGRATDMRNAFKPIVDLVAGLISNIYDALKGPLEFVVGDTSSVGRIDSSGIFFAKILLLILIFSVVFSILKNTGISFFKGSTLGIVSLAVSILSVRFIGSDFIEMIVVPYSTLGVVLTAVIPFVIYFFFVEGEMGFLLKINPNPRFWGRMRRAAWIFFGVVFLLIWIYAMDKLPQDSLAGLIYPMTALVGFLMCVFDGTIQNLFSNISFEKAMVDVRRKHMAFYFDKMNEVEERWNKAIELGDPDRYIAVFNNGGIKAGKHKGIKAYNSDIDFLNKCLQTGEEWQKNKTFGASWELHLNH